MGEILNMHLEKEGGGGWRDMGRITNNRGPCKLCSNSSEHLSAYSPRERLNNSCTVTRNTPEEYHWGCEGAEWRVDARWMILKRRDGWEPIDAWKRGSLKNVQTTRAQPRRKATSLFLFILLLFCTFPDLEFVYFPAELVQTTIYETSCQIRILEEFKNKTALLFSPHGESSSATKASLLPFPSIDAGASFSLQLRGARPTAVYKI